MLLAEGEGNEHKGSAIWVAPLSSSRHPEAPRFHQRGEGSRVECLWTQLDAREILPSAWKTAPVRMTPTGKRRRRLLSYAAIQP